MSETDARTEGRPRRKVRVGVVVSAKMQKTVVVRVDRRFAHPVYGKPVVRSKKYYADNPNDEAKEGDRVEIVETRPLSKLKRWRVRRILERAR
jgi:small subunit ribosomal protein S17